MLDTSQANRRQFLGAAAAAGGALLLPESLARAATDDEPARLAHRSGTPVQLYQLPELPYAVDALEPVIDKKTVQLHHTKHHDAYTRGLNATLRRIQTALAQEDNAAIPGLVQHLAFHGAGYANHNLYWQNMLPPGQGGGEPAGKLAGRIKEDFGGFDEFRRCFSSAANGVQGNGWTMLAYHPDWRQLLVLALTNHENRLIPGVVPLLMLDLWEHAYYIRYLNRRAEYVTAWWDLVNWRDVQKRFEALATGG